MKIYSIATAAVLLAVAAGAAQAGPVGDYYLTDGYNNQNWIVIGNTATSYTQAEGSEYAVAVSGDVRTLGYNGGLGAQYTLGLSPTGVTYSPPNIAYTNFYDGTTDGSSNYAVGFNDGKVYQMGRDWSNPTVLFDTGLGAGGALGITYDSGNGTLWVSGYDGQSVSDYSLGGKLLSSFNTTFNAIISLAYDPADGSLWMGTQNDQFNATARTLYQYSTAGSLLSTESYTALVGTNYLGGEFNITASAVPEPSSLALLGAAAVSGCVLGLRRKLAAN